MQTCIKKDHSYRGKTRNPNGEILDSLMNRYKRIRGPQQMRQLLAIWGLLPDQKQGKA